VSAKILANPELRASRNSSPCLKSRRTRAALVAIACRVDQNDSTGQYGGRLSSDPDGKAIGRIYEQRPPAPPDGAWVWSVLCLGRPGWERVKADGRAATFEDAKAAFAASWKAFKAADSDSKPA
jgi:hypothetical protein